MEEAPRMIHLENISKEYDGATVLSDINLYILKNECGENFFQHSISFLFKQTTQRVAQALIQRLRAPVHLGAVGAVERACKLALLGLG